MDEPSHRSEAHHLSPPPPPLPRGLEASVLAGQLRRFALVGGILALSFVNPLWELIRMAAASQLYSYILLVPFISLYLIWLKRGSLPAAARPARVVAGVFLLAGLGTLCVYWLGLPNVGEFAKDDYLAVAMVAFLLLLYSVCCLFWGKDTLRAVAFPLAFLLFMIPIPKAALLVIDAFLQKGSALAAAGFFSVAGTPYLQDGLVFQLPDISLQIAPECSGIHSTVVLFITSLLASYLFLRTPWKRAVLTLFVIPLGLIRNGFRVFVIGELCVHIGPRMINSYIHHKGGPIFFVLSLIPLFLLLLWLRNSERRHLKNRLLTELQGAAGPRPHPSPLPPDGRGCPKGG